MIAHTLNNAQQWLERLQSSGYRLTGPRYAVIDILAKSERPLNAQEVYELARQRYPSIGLVSIYRTIEKLEALQLIQRVHQADQCHAYIAAFDGHQHLILCQGCGLVSYFDGDDLEALMSKIEEDSGYKVSGHWLQLFGVCEKCRDTLEKEK